MINRTEHMVVCYERSYKIWTSGWLHLFSEFISRNIWLEGSLHMKYSSSGEKFVSHLEITMQCLTAPFCNLSNLFVNIHIKCQYMIGSDDESLILGTLPPLYQEFQCAIIILSLTSQFVTLFIQQKIEYKIIEI